MVLAVARPMMRRSIGNLRTAGRRFESNAAAQGKAAVNATKETAGKAADAAKQGASKAADATKEGASRAADATKEGAARANAAAQQTAASASSTVKDTASKATAAASEYTAKAAQGLSRVTSSAGPVLVNAAKGVTGALGRVGGRTGRFVGFVERQAPFVAYYSRVGLEMSKLVFRGQRMSPPSLQTFQSYFQNAWAQIRNPSSLFQSVQRAGIQAAESPSAVMQRIRGLSSAQMVTMGVIAAECLGFFTVGEMVGRFKLIGYHGHGSTHH